MDVNKLKILHASHLSQKYALEDKILKEYPRDIKRLTERITGFKIDAETAAKHLSSKDQFPPMTFTSEEHKICLSGLISDFFGVDVPVEEITIENPYSIASFREVIKDEEVPVLRHTLKDVAASLKFADFVSELQVRSTRFFDERALYYPFDRFCKNYNKQGFMEISLDGKPNRYSSIIPIYSLNILGDSHFQDEDALRIFELYDHVRSKKYKKELIKIGFFELTKNKIETPNQRYWRDYFITGKAHPEAPEYIHKASSIIEYENLSEEERNVSAVLEKARADYDAGFSSAYHDGLENGLLEGLEKGLHEGLERGLNEGLEKGSIEIAKNMLRDNVPIEKVVRYVRLDESTIIQLKTELDSQ